MPSPEDQDPEPTSQGKTFRDRTAWKVFIDNLLIVFIVIAVAIGIGLGVGLQDVWGPEEKRKIFYLEFPGRLLLNMLKMLILPLIVSSLITGMASIGSQASGRLGLGAIIYYMSTTLVAVVTGIILVLSIHPGDPDDKEDIERKGKSVDSDPLDTLLDLVSQCFPDNLVSATFERKVTRITRENITVSENHTVEVDVPKLEASSGMNVLGVVVFSIALGVVINQLGEEGEPLKRFFESLNSAIMVLVNLVIWYSPIGILFLIAAKFVDSGDLSEVFRQLGLYMATVLSGLAIHGLFTLPLIFFITTRKNPARFALNMMKAIFTAWGTASSSATLPVTMDCLVNKNKVNLNIVRFVAPVGATINMDGTALYEAVASIFIAQVNDYDLSAADVIIISLTATAAAIGAAGVPQAGLVTMVIVLTAVGLPTEDVTLILAVDWFLDRFRTALNVWGDSVGAGILSHIFRSTFPPSDSVEFELTVEDPDDDKSKRNGSVSAPPQYNEAFDESEVTPM